MIKQYRLGKLESGIHFIDLDTSTFEEITSSGTKRAVCILNETERFHCAIMPKKGGGHFVHIGLKICKKLRIVEGSLVAARFELDASEYQFEMPEELAEVFRTDMQARDVFLTLTKGNQRGLMYLIGQVKSSEKKIERALKIAAKLKAGITSPKEILK